MISSVLVSCALSLTASTPNRIALQPVDSHLIPEARKVLNYLESVYGKKTLSGMASYGGWRTVFGICGRAPAIYSKQGNLTDSRKLDSRL